MNDNQQVGIWGAVSLIVTLITTKMLISAPSLFAKQSASAGWIEVTISGIFELFVLAIILKLMSSYENMDIIDISEKHFGKFGRIMAGTLSMVVFVISSAAVFRCFCELIRNTVMRGMSYDDISLFLLVASIVSAYIGMRKLISLSGLMLPFIIGAIVLVLLINLPRYSVTNILPIAGVGIKDLTRNALLKNASFYELGIFIFLLPYLKDKTSVKKICFTGLLISVFLSSIITLFYQLSVPYEAAGTFALPLYQMTRMIKAGTFFQRIEPLNIFIWGSAMYSYVGVGVRMSAHIYKKTFKIPQTRPLVFAFAYIVSLIALIPGSETSVEQIYDFMMTYSYLAYPVFPLLLLIVCSLFQKKGKRC